VQRYAGQRAHQLKPGKAVRACFGFAMLEQRSPDAPTRMVRIDEERANPGSVCRRVEFASIALRVRVAAEQGTPSAPTPAPDDSVPERDGEIGSVIDQLGVDAEGTGQSRLDLLRAVIAPRKPARRTGDQALEPGPIGACSFTQ
jgi:hypothetical protein